MAGKGKFSLEAIFSAVDKLSAPLAKIKTKLAGFGKAAGSAMRSANSAVDKGLAGIGKFSNLLGIAGVVSIAAIGFQLKDVMEKGQTFEQTLIRAGAALQVPAKKGTAEFKKLGEAAKQIGRTTEFGAQQAAEGLESLITAGYTATSAIGALPKVVDFATAGQLGIAQSSEIASNALGAFNLKSEDAVKNATNMGRVMDVMVRAGADSQTTITELAAAFEEGAATASKAGASVEEFSGLLGVLASSGMKGSKAGTALRNVYTRLNKQTPVAAKMMKKYHIEVARGKDGTIDMAATVGNFSKQLKGLSLNQQQAAIATIFGDEAMGGFLSLMGTGPDKIAEFVEALKGATGTTKKMADTFREGSELKLKKFFNIIDNVKLDVFEAISGTVTEIAESISDWVLANEDLISSKADEWMTALKENLPAIWIWSVRIAKAFAAFVVFAATVKILNTAVLAYELAVKLAAVAVKAWGVAVDVATFVAGVAMKAWGLAVEAATFVAGVAAKAWGVAVEAASVVASLAAKAWGVAVEAATVVASLAAKAWGVAVQAATVVASLAQKAWGLAVVAATLVASGAQLAYEAVVAKTTGVIIPAIGAQVAAMAPLLLAIGAASLAVGALFLAWDQFNKLDKDLAGSGGITGTIGKMVDMGTLNPFEAHDAAMNEKARAEARDREAPQIINPGTRAASEAASAAAGASGTVDGKIIVEAKAGTKAQVKSKPRTPTLVLGPSGAF